MPRSRLRRLWSWMRGHDSTGDDPTWWRTYLDARADTRADTPTDTRPHPRTGPAATPPPTPWTNDARPRIRVHPDRLEHRSSPVDLDTAIDLVSLDPDLQDTTRLRVLHGLAERIATAARTPAQSADEPSERSYSK